MARNRIEELLVELKFQGGEELKKISGGFRELAKAVNLADADIEDARTKIIDYGRTLGNTNQAVKGTIQALKALQDSTQRGGEAWNQLSRDVLQFEQAARLTDREIESLRRGIAAEAAAHSQSETSIRAHVRALQELRAQSVLGGQVNRQLSQTIGQLTQQLEQAEQASRAHFGALNQMLAVRPDAVLRQYQAYTQVLGDVRATAEQAAEAQQRLNQLAGAPRIAARRELVARAGIQADPAYQERFGLGGRSLEEMPDVPAALSLRLQDLQKDLSLTTRNTDLYIRTLVEMASVQRQASASTQGFAAALREQLASGELPRTQKNLQEVIGALRRGMIELDTSTTTGSRAYAENAAQVRVLERELNQLANSYRNVADMAAQAATAERSAATARVTALYMNNRAVRDQAQAMADLGNAVRSGIAGTPLMLPAAGQTSAAGTGLQVSGGARIGGPSGNVQRVLTPGTFPGERQQGPEMSPEQADSNRRAYLSQIDAERQLRETREASERQLQGYRAEISKASQANDGSINSIQRYRDSLVTLRNTIPSTESEFKRLTAQVQQLDAQLERAQRSRRRMSAMEATQAAGAVISGGIFGGPEGAIGGGIGAAVGGVPGAFAGAAIGAQAGMIRQSLGGTAEYAASLGKLQIALRGVVGSQAAYDQAIRAAAAATRDLNIPQEEATRGLTRLSAAVIGAGGTVTDSGFAFRAMAEAIKATGGDAEKVDGALLALTQVFSKGKVSAEELNQIAERLPGTFTLFAQAAGKTGPELQKSLQKGEVGLDDLMKFLALVGKRYSGTALEISKSSQDAGARLAIAFQAMRLEVGKALQPLGAEIQEAFTAFIKDITPSVVSSVKAIAEVLKFFTNNQAAAGLAKFAFELTAFSLAIKGLQGAASGLIALNMASWFTGAATGAKITGDVAASAAPKVGLLRTALSGFIGLAAKPIVVTIVIASVIEAIKRITAANNAFAEFYKLAKQPVPANTWLKNVGGDALGADKLKELRAQSTNAIKFNRSEIERLKKDKAAVLLQESFALDNAGRAPLNTQLVTINTQIATAERRIQEAQGRLNAVNAQLKNPRTAAGLSLTNFPDPAGEDAKDKAAEKARKDAEAVAAEQQRYLESFMQQQIRVADTVFQHQKDLDRQRFDLLRELTDIEAQNRINKLFGPEREAASIQERRRQRTLEYENRILAAMNEVAAAQQKLSGAQRMATVTAGLSSGTGVPSIGGFTPQQLSSATTAASKFTGIANMCSESVKAFYKSLGITLPGVTAWADTVRKSGQVMTDWSKLQAGDIVATGRPGDTPHVGVYTGGNNVFHQSRNRGLTAGNYPDLDYFRSGYFVRPTAAAAGRQATGVASQQRRNVADTGDVAIADLELKKAQAALTNLTALRGRYNAAFDDEQVNALTDAFTSQNAELEKTIAIETERFGLVMKGYSDERVALEQKFAEQRRLRDAQLEGVTPGDASQIVAINTAYEQTLVLLQQLYDAQTKFNEAMRLRQDDRIGLGMQEGVNSYIESIGTMRKATEELTVNGIKGVENAIYDLVTTGKTNFREFAADILRQTARMIIQQLVLRQVMLIVKSAFGFSSGGVFGGGGGGLGSVESNLAQYAPLSGGYAMGGAFAKNGIVPYAKGGIVDKPTLFKFANGGMMQTGVMGEAGPEAIIPLKRGRDGQLGVSGGSGGSTNVTVNVDASGSKVQGDSNKSEQLGRAVSQAVQDELLRQKRPGGLLAA